MYVSFIVECNESEFNIRSLEISHRHAKQFKRIIYIAFSCDSDDLEILGDKSRDTNASSGDSENDSAKDADMASEQDREDSNPDIKVFPLLCITVKQLF